MYMRNSPLRDASQPRAGYYATPERIGVAIYEREPLVRHGLRSMVNGFDQTYVLREIEEPAASLVVAPHSERRINLVGPSVVPRLSMLVNQSTTPTVALVSGCSYAEFNEVRRSGVRGLVLIDEVAHDLEFAITSVAAGRAFLSARFAERVFEWMSDRTTKGQPNRIGGAPDLTPRECEVMVLLGRGHTNREIATSLNVQDTTVRTHLCHILTKLNLRNRTAAVLYAIQSDLYGCFL